MATAPEITPSPMVIDEETSLVDFLRAKENGLDVRQAASLFHAALKPLEEQGHNLYGRMLLGPSDAEVQLQYHRELDERTMVMLASNNYLGLTAHPQVIEAARQAALEYGTGAGSSPLLVGTFPITRRLEAKLAEFKGAEEACVFATGYSTNVGVISSVAGKHDVVILDRLSHASMVDGAKLSGAQTKVFRHNDVDHLDRVLSRCSDAQLKLVAVEGLYSMDGDLAPLDEIHEVVRRHGALLLVDEAHSTGVLGPGGRGAAAYLGWKAKSIFTLARSAKRWAPAAGSWPAKAT